MTDVFQSIFSTLPVFAYRCRNDDQYTMDFMEGAFRDLTGYDKADVIGNAKISYVGLTCGDDVDRVFAEVDAAIETGQPWDVAYRLTHASGSLVHVRERGCAIYEDGELAYLQGIVTGAGAEQDLQHSLRENAQANERRSQAVSDMTVKIVDSLRMLDMLAINARIEGGRAGSAGYGFIVVADEIKSLAEKNSAWAGEIAAILNNSQP